MTDKNHPSENQLIEVTPEMIEAGLYWLDLYDPDYSDHAEFLTKIFAAMEFARRNAKKWCSYCQKNNHNDAECWSTRPANWRASGLIVPGDIS